MRVIRFHPVAAKLHQFVTIEQHVYGALQVAALDDHRAGAQLHDLARRRFHVRYIFDGQPG